MFTKYSRFKRNRPVRPIKNVAIADMENTLFCLIVDDEPLAQDVLGTYIGRLDQLKLVCKCETLEEAYEVLNSRPIDVVFLDLNLGPVSGIDLIKKKLLKKKFI